MANEKGELIEKEQNKPICRSCGKEVLAKGSNTTNLFQHLREHHPSEYAEIASKSTTTAQRGESSKTMQPTILDTLSNST